MKLGVVGQVAFASTDAAVNWTPNRVGDPRRPPGQVGHALLEFFDLSLEADHTVLYVRHILPDVEE
jgi:hypothetical protein